MKWFGRLAKVTGRKKEALYVDCNFRRPRRHLMYVVVLWALLEVNYA
jgi:hypothetical protein